MIGILMKNQQKSPKNPQCVNHPTRLAQYSDPRQTGTPPTVVWCEECDYKSAAKIRNLVSTFKVRMLRNGYRWKGDIWKGAPRGFKETWIEAVMKDRHRFEHAREAAILKY